MSWLDSMPSSWELRSPKSLFNERRTPNLPDDVHLTPSQKYGVLPQSEYIEITGGSVVLNLTGQNTMKHVEPNDFIIHLRSFQGGLERARQSGKVSTAYTVVEPKKASNSGFFRWLLKSSAFIQELQTTTNQLRDGQSIRWSDFVKVPLPTPPLDEQQAIADYLDRETQKIDELITEQRGLIETLRERRQALIDRGAENSVAEHTRLRYLFAPSEVRNRRNEQVLSVYREYGVIPKGSREGNRNVTPEDVSRYLLVHPGDLVVNRMKAWQGSLGVSQYQGIVSGDYEVLRPTTDQLLPQFVHLYLRSARMVGQYVVRSTGIRPSQWRLYWKQMADIKMPVPSVRKQQEIVSFVNEQTSRIDELISESEDLIALSQERRAVLITAAVTGQIDVRTAA